MHVLDELTLGDGLGCATWGSWSWRRGAGVSGCHKIERDLTGGILYAGSEFLRQLFFRRWFLTNTWIDEFRATQILQLEGGSEEFIHVAFNGGVPLRCTLLRPCLHGRKLSAVNQVTDG